MTAASKVYSKLNADLTTPTASAHFELGECLYGDQDSEFIYVQADSAGITGAGYVVLIDESFAADMVDTTNSASGFGQRCGVAPVAFSANQYGWVQVRGVADIRGAANAAANAALNTTATAGQIDDDGTAGAETIDGIVFTTAVGGSAGTAEGVLDDPRIGATLA